MQVSTGIVLNNNFILAIEAIGVHFSFKKL